MIKRGFSFLLLAFLVVGISHAEAAKTFRVALIADGPMAQLKEVEGYYRREILALTEGEFDVTFQRFQAQWSRESIEQAFDSAYQDPRTDLVLAVGIASNQLGVSRKNYPKPTFLPIIFDADLLGAPSDGNKSGKKNLNYLTDRVDFRQDLESFMRVAPYKKLALIADAAVLSAIPEILVNEIEKNADIDIQFIAHDGVNHKVDALLPSDTEAVMVAGLPRMPEGDFLEMINGINAKRLPSYSLVGDQVVAQGMLVADAPAEDWQRLARRNALNMQAVMLGEKAENQSIIFEGKRQLTINMETARIIGLSPRFDVLSEATLLNEEPEKSGPEYTLANIAQFAVRRNQDLAAESYSVSANEYNIKTARANLLPQLTLQGIYLERKKSDAVRAGQLPEKSSDAAVALNQVLYADDPWSNLTVQRQLQLGREAAFEQSRLDTIQFATTALLNVLRAQTQLRVQKDNLGLTKTNLDLARDRVKVGSSTAADQYRWESRLATDKATLLNAQASLNQARENLNRILHRPITERFQIVPAKLGDAFVMTEAEFNQLIDNSKTFKICTSYMVQGGFSLSPELVQLETQRAAKNREVTNIKRSFWLPDFTVNGQYNKNFDQSNSSVSGSGPGEGDLDWNVSINASIPLYQGGARKSELAKARTELKQVETQIIATKERIEQNIRANIHTANASYTNITLSAESASSGRKNLELVTDSYAQGVVSVIELLDAQNASLQADEAAANAVYDFLINIMDLQRSVGEFEFTLPAEEGKRNAEKLKNYITAQNKATQKR